MDKRCAFATAMDERILFFRNLREITQKYLGQVVGFPEKTADIHMAQYDFGSRTPKSDFTNSIVKILCISPLPLSIPRFNAHTVYIRG